MTTILPRKSRALRELLAEQGVRLASDCGGAGTCGKCRVRVTGSGRTRAVLACQYVPEETVTVETPRSVPHPANVGRPARSIKRDVSRALAVDVGTTTISLAAVDVQRRRVVRHRDELNPQLAYGADVMSRIAQTRKVRSAGVHELILRFMDEVGINRRRTVTAVGNTVMAHFLFGRNPAGLGAYPYRSALPLRKTITGRHGSMGLQMLPLLGSFVGSDCTAAILACGMHRSRRLSLLVDAGTNGEVVLGNRERMLVCSTAAGPAFEGATLECGSLAKPGAVKAVRLSRGRFVLETVGRATARSICGSGVLDAVAVAVETGLVERSGRIARGTQRLMLYDGDEPVFLSQADLREVQLAKGAIAAGIRLLLKEWGAAPANLDRVYLTGKFGAAMNPASAMRIGLLPRVPAGIIRRHDNMALLGAVRATWNHVLFKEAEAVAAGCREVVLVDHPRFEQEFVDSMSLEPWR